MNGWFGESWGAPVCQAEQRVPTPVGKQCMWCSEPIAAGDQGHVMPTISIRRSPPWWAFWREGWREGLKNQFQSVPHAELGAYHRYCLTRAVVGSLGHQMGLCPCHGGTTEDPDDLTPREAAKAASIYFEWNMLASVSPRRSHAT